jgi:hypothetical protein
VGNRLAADRRAQQNRGVTLDELDARRDVVERLAAAGIDYYVTGSEAMAIHGIAFRQTNDTDFVVAIAPAHYETRLRPAFEPDYMVNPLVEHPPRWLGSAIHVRAVTKADFIIREPGPWPDDAHARRVLLDDPSMGPVWVASVEDLLLAKLEWSGGDLSGLQGRDAHAITALPGTLDRAYLRRHAAALGVDALLVQVLDGA